MGDESGGRLERDKLLEEFELELERMRSERDAIGDDIEDRKRRVEALKRIRLPPNPRPDELMFPFVGFAVSIGLVVAGFVYFRGLASIDIVDGGLLITTIVAGASGVAWVASQLSKRSKRKQAGRQALIENVLLSAASVKGLSLAMFARIVKLDRFDAEESEVALKHLRDQGLLVVNPESGNYQLPNAASQELLSDASQKLLRAADSSA